MNVNRLHVIRKSQFFHKNVRMYHFLLMARNNMVDYYLEQCFSTFLVSLGQLCQYFAVSLYTKIGLEVNKSGGTPVENQ